MDPCRYLASTIAAELSRWTGFNEIKNAPIAETRRGPQPEGGVPGVLVDGCVWEAHGPVGGHIGIAVERFTDVEMNLLAAMAANAGVTASMFGDGQQSWNVPASDDSPSGAVLVGDRSKLVVVRVESYSDDSSGIFVAGALDGSGRFFRAIGDAMVEAYRLD